MLKGEYGTVPPNFLWIIAGREELDRNQWAEYEGILARLPLEPFSEEEARQYLSRRGVTDERTMAVILNLSGRFPLLVAMLAEGTPSHPDQVDDPSGTAVERFLKWEADPKRRQIALDAALPRCLNQDVIAQLRPEDDATNLFIWLKQKPFVRQRTDGWVYHEVVRTQMLRHKRSTTPQGWAELHGTLAQYHDKLRSDLQLDAKDGQRDTTWQNHTLNVLYHRLCQSPQKHILVALSEFLAALKNQRKFAEQWAGVIAQAGRDAGANEIQRWGEQLTEGLKAYNEERYEVTLAMFGALVEHPGIDAQQRPIAHAWRGETYRIMKRYEEALQDFNRAIELDPKHIWVFNQRGKVYWLTDRYEEALRDFSHVIELDPSNNHALANRGRIYGSMKLHEQALQDVNCAIELAPTSSWALLSRGRVYRDLGLYEEALRDANRAVEVDPNSSVARYSRGRTYKAMGRYEEALQDFDCAIRLNYALAAATEQRGKTHQLLKRYEKALQDFNLLIELTPHDSWAIARRGQIYLLLGRYKDALADLDRALELNTQNDWWLYSRAISYQVLGEIESAKINLLEAIHLAQLDYEKKLDNYRNTFNLALYYLAVGEDQQAKIFYQDALHRGADRQYVREAIQDLENLLTLFPDHALARKVHQALLKALDLLPNRLGKSHEVTDPLQNH